MSRADVEELRLQISALRVRVFAQEERIEELERRLGEGSRPASSAPPSEVLRGPPSEAGSGVGSYSFLTEPSLGPATGPVTAEDHEGRVRLAKQCRGRFLRRALSGDFRGSSGRDRLRLQSRHYVVAKSYEGEVYSPVKVFEHFSQVRELCKRDFSCGQAVFLGFATKWELRLALEEGEFERPAGL